MNALFDFILRLYSVDTISLALNLFFDQNGSFLRNIHPFYACCVSYWATPEIANRKMVISWSVSVQLEQFQQSIRHFSLCITYINSIVKLTVHVNMSTVPKCRNSLR